jgi:hypothetical protein
VAAVLAPAGVDGGGAREHGDASLRYDTTDVLPGVAYLRFFGSLWR